jgi:hypothetical protein
MAWRSLGWHKAQSIEIDFGRAEGGGKRLKLMLRPA